MDFTGKKLLNKVIAILAIIALTMSDFIIIGTNLVSYAADVQTTTLLKDCVDFSAYFIDSNEQKTDEIKKDVDTTNLKMYVDISVKNQGYFDDGQLSLKTANFKIKNNVLKDSKDYIDKIENGIVYLKRIDGVKNVTIALEIEQDLPEVLSASKLNMNSEVYLKGAYTQSKKTNGTKTDKIEGSSSIKLEWKSSENAKAETSLEVLTNDRFLIEGESKWIVQLLATSKITDNNYPVEYTKIDINCPAVADYPVIREKVDVNVRAKNTSATNGNQGCNYTYDKNTGKVSIIVENKADADGNIRFNRNSADEFIITYIYPINTDMRVSNSNEANIVNTSNVTNTVFESNSNATVNTNTNVTNNNSTVETNTNITNNTTNTIENSTTVDIEQINSTISKWNFISSTIIKPYNSKEITDNKTVNLNGSKDGTITYEVSNTEKEMYKGKIYTGEARDYETTTKININKAGNAEKIQVNELEAVYISDESNSANIYYTQTKISKSDFLKLFGTENGFIKFTDKSGTVLANINSSIQANEAGDIIIKYPAGIKEIKIETSKPITEGTLNVVNTKTIKGKEFDREKIRTFTQIKERVSGSYDDEYNNGKNNIEMSNSISLIETSSKASLNLTNKSLSTSEATNTTVTVTLETDKESKDLYKNPNIKVTLPKQVTKYSFTAGLLNPNGLELNKDNIQKSREGENFVITFNLTGEQSEYVTDITKGTSLKIDFNLELDNLAVTSNEEIKVNYTNENVVTYADNGELKEAVSIIAKNPLIVTNKINELNIQTSQEDKKDVELEINSEAKELTNVMSIVNNETSEISDIKILGKYPTNNSKNNMGITIKTPAVSITKKDEKVYYSTEENPTADLTNTNNKWSEKSSENDKSYLIVINSLKVGENFSFGFKMSVPEKLNYNLSAETGYTVSYENKESNTKNTVKATTIELNTGKAAMLEQTVVATVGGEKIKNGDTVRTGEIIKYTVTVKNNGNEDATGVSIEGNIPEGTNYIEYNKNIKLPDSPVPDSEPDMFVEDTNKKQVKVENGTIKAKSQVTFEYMVKVNAKENKEVENKIVVTNSKGDKKENIITHKLEKSEIEAVLLKVDSIYSSEIKAGNKYRYTLKIKNTSNKEKKNVQVQLNMNELLNLKQSSYKIEEKTFEQTEKNFTIEKINAGEELNITISVDAKQPTNELDSAKLYIKLIDGNAIYRTNAINEDVKAIELNISYTSKSTSNAEGYLHIGDKVQYTIKIKNTGKIDANSLRVEDQFSDFLELESIKLNNENAKYFKNNVYAEGANYSILNIQAPLKVGEEAIIVITAKVDDSLKINEIAKIINKATIYNEVEIAKTDEIVYFIEKASIPKGVEEEPEQVEEDEQNNGENSNKNNNTNDNQNNNQNNNNQADKPAQNNNSANGNITNGEPNNTNNQQQTNNSNDNTNTQKVNTYTITGTAWKDQNENGAREQGETLISDINVKLINVGTKKFVTNESGDEVLTKTNSEGLYNITNIPAGKYIVVFEYDTSKFVPTTYKADGVQNDKNSDVILNSISMNGETKQMATTDIITLNNSIANIDFGLIDAKVFDLQLEKYITKVVVTNNSGTSSYEFNNSTLAKADIAAKDLNSSQVVVEYTIKVKNAGEIAGYVKNIIDYKPTGLSFSSTLNSEWYARGDYLYNSSLANAKLEPGETKEIKLILTKQMTESNTGLIGNTAEIAEAYNTRGTVDKDSTPGNRVRGEDDMGQADLIIGVKTGAVISYIMITLSIIIVIGIAGYLISKKVLSKEIKFE